MNKWITSIFLVSIARAVFFPDYRHNLSIAVILFLLPVICGALTIASRIKAKSKWSVIITTGLFAIYLSDVIGTVIYGFSAGWRYVKEDIETHAILISTVSIQTIVFLICILIGWGYQKRSNNIIKRMENTSS